LLLLLLLCYASATPLTVTSYLSGKQNDTKVFCIIKECDQRARALSVGKRRQSVGESKWLDGIKSSFVVSVLLIVCATQ
jgi:hypothetical protein